MITNLVWKELNWKCLNWKGNTLNGKKKIPSYFVIPYLVGCITFIRCITNEFLLLVGPRRLGIWGIIPVSHILISLVITTTKLQNWVLNRKLWMKTFYHISDVFKSISDMTKADIKMIIFSSLRLCIEETTF